MAEPLSTAEVARRLGKDVRTVHRLVDAGRLQPIIKTPGLRGAYMFDPDAIEKFITETKADA